MGEGRNFSYIYGKIRFFLSNAIFKTMENNKQSKLSKWLESLQQERWQLELIVSGFAIFLVGSLEEPLDIWTNHLQIASMGFKNSFFLMMPLVVLQGACFFFY